jgi:hypothetical protein
MTSTASSKEVQGIRAVCNLLKMLAEAAAACRVDVSELTDMTDNLGLALGRNRYTVTIGISEPATLSFATQCQIDADAAAKLGIGVIEESSLIPGGFRWRRGAKLDSMEVDFFSRTAVGQMFWLEEFLHDCLAKAHSIETRDQPRIPEEAEEN